MNEPQKGCFPFIHHPYEIECRSSYHHIDIVAGYALVEVSSQPVVDRYRPGSFPTKRATCSKAGGKVCPSYSFRKPIAPTITPVFWVLTMDTLFANSYFLCSLPLELQSTSGSCSEYTLFLLLRVWASTCSWDGCGSAVQHRVFLVPGQWAEPRLKTLPINTMR